MAEMTKEEVLNLGLILQNHKDQVAHAEQETLRLKRQGESELYTLNEIRKAKIELDELISVNTSNLNSIKNELFQTQEEVTEKKTILMNLNIEISEKISDQTAKETALKEREDAVNKKEIEVNELQSVVLASKTDHEIEKNDFYEKVAKLKEITSKI